MIAEREVKCTVENFTGTESTTVYDPVLGNVELAFMIRWNYVCDDPYLQARGIGLQDAYTDQNGDLHYGGYYKLLTGEGGVWQGTGEVHNGASTSLYYGKGLYEGLILQAEGASEGLPEKIKVIKPTNFGPTPTPVEGALIYETEVTCPVSDVIPRGDGLSMVYSCTEPYLQGKSFSIIDTDKSAEPWVVSEFTEIVTGEGVWKGMCAATQDPKVNFPDKGKCIFSGERGYNGLMMTMAWDGDQVKIRVTEVAV